MVAKFYNAEIESVHFGAYPGMNTTFKTINESSSSENSTETPLTLACSKGRFEIVKFLIESGADVNQNDYSHISPILKAASNGHKNIVKLLISYGAKINYDLLCLVKMKIEQLEDKVKQGIEDQSAIFEWKIFLDFLIREGKKQ